MPMQPPQMARPLSLPKELLDKIASTQEAGGSKTTQANDASRVRQYLQFCASHGIKSSDAFPAKEDLLVAWAASFSGAISGSNSHCKAGCTQKRAQEARLGLAGRGALATNLERGGEAKTCFII